MLIFFILVCFSIPSFDSVKELDELQSKLQAYYAKYDKDTGLSKRFVPQFAFSINISFLLITCSLVGGCL